MRMRRAATVVVLWVVVLAAGPAAAGELIVGPRPQSVDDCWVLDPPGITLVTWASGLTAPWSLAILPDGRALVSERRGRILLIERRGDRRPGDDRVLRITAD